MTRMTTPDVMGDVLAPAAARRMAGSLLRMDGGTQPRDQISDELVMEYRDAMAEGALFPPVVAFFDGSDYWLADGFHRVHAADAAGIEVLVDVRQGTRRDAVLFSAGANATHGQRRTNADKRRAVLALLHDDEWRQWSDREIARRCAVSNRFVGDVRAELSVNGSQMETRRVVRQGTEYDMAVPQRAAAPSRDSQAASYMTPDGLVDAVRRWAERFEDAREAATGLFANWVSGSGSYLDDWTNSAPAPWRSNDLPAAIRVVQGVTEQAGLLGGVNERSAPQQPVRVDPASSMSREERAAAAMAYDRERKHIARAAAETFVVYAEEHGYTGVLRWIAYRIHPTAQWDELASMVRRELWQVIAENLMNEVLARQDRNASLESLRVVIDERFHDAGMNGVLWPDNR